MKGTVSKRVFVITVIACCVVSAVAGAAAALAMQRSKVAELESRLEYLSTELADPRSASAETTPGTDTSLDATEAPEAVTETPSAEATVQPERTPTATKTREFAFVQKVKGGASPSLVADYAQFLTGKKAAEAAAAEGEESPPPNDYYIVNENSKPRTLPVKKGVRVSLVTRPDGTMDVDPYTVPFATWAGYYAEPTDTNSAIRDAGYWLAVVDGTVTAIEEQFIP